MNKTKATFKTNDSGSRFTVAVNLKQLDQSKLSHETASILRVIADQLDRAEFTVSRCQQTWI